MDNEINMAVLIDADNVSYQNVTNILDEVAKLGKPTIKRIYADWTGPTMSGWKQVLLNNAIVPMQQYSYTSGKNSTDSALIIDAMDILYDGKVDGFCIVSSDSDFTKLATRLREAGKLVVGMGETKTPAPFIAACNKFIYLDLLDEKSSVPDSTGQSTSSRRELDSDIINLLEKYTDELADESDSFASLADVGNALSKARPQFDPRLYGFSKLSALVASLSDRFEMQYRQIKADSSVKLVYIRRKS